MPFYLFRWDDANEEHLAQNDVTMEEFEEVVCDPDSVGKSRSSNRPIAFGYTSGGRYLACVYEMLDEVTVYPITAYELDD